VFLVKFKTGQALPLPGGRFSRPRTVAGRAGDGFAICIAHGRKRGPATAMIRFNIGHGLKLSMSTNSLHPSPVHANNYIHNQSVLTNWQWQQLSPNRQRHWSWIVHRQSQVVNHPRRQTHCEPRLLTNSNWQGTVRGTAASRPHHCRPVSLFTFKPFRIMTTFDPSTVRKAVADFTPLRPQHFQVVEKSLPA